MPRRPPPPAALPPRDPSHDVAGNHYWRYHTLDALLACKRPVTASADEDLFIAVHQVCELCFHQMIVDLERALDGFARALRDADDGVVGDTGEAVYFLRRVVALWRVANRAMPTLTGLRAFGEFRPSLGPSSGFQSAQFRHLEILAGVDHAWWRGGTRDANGALHPAELAFEARHGAEVDAWIARHRDHSLVAHHATLRARASLAALRRHPHARPLLVALRDYDREQTRFHHAHVGVAVEQLARVGVHVGTGGTSFRDYLTRYERERAPLFAGLERGLSPRRSAAPASKRAR